MRNLVVVFLLLGCTQLVRAQPTSMTEPVREGPLRLEADGKLRLLEAPPKVIELQTVEGNVGQPMPKLRPTPWYNSPEVGWGLAPVGLYWQDPWAPYYGRSSLSSPYGPCW